MRNDVTIHIHHIYWLLLVSVALLLSSCGGGNNESGGAANHYIVSTSTETGGNTNPVKATAIKGTITHFTIIPDSGYSISSVTGCGGSLIGNTYTTAAITTNCTVSASFSINSYSVSATAEPGGSITPSSRIANHGEVIHFTVTPDSGYSISSVIGCGGSLTGNTYTTGVITTNCTVSSTSIIDTTAPVAHITFPPPQALTEGSTITVRGTASDANDITTVRVNGVDATTDNGYATWAVPITLSSGLNTLTVETIDGENNYEPNAAQAQINAIGVLLHRIHGIAMDNANNRVLVVDLLLKAVVAVDLTSGVRTIISDSATPDAINPFAHPVDLVLDSAQNRVLVVDWVLDDVIAVDLTTGARSIISVNGLDIPRELVLDKVNNRLLVLDSGGQGAVVAVDLASGTRTTVINNIPGSRGLALDSVNNRILVGSGSLSALIAVDLATGAKSILSDPTMPDVLSHPESLVLDSANNRALVLNRKTNILVAVDLATGVHTIVSNDLAPKVDGALEGLRDLVLDSAQNRVLVVAEGLDAVIAVDLTTGIRTIVSNGIIPNRVSTLSEPVFREPNSLVLDNANNRALVLDSRLDTVVAVDLLTGRRSIISDDAFGLFSSPESLVLDSANNRVLIIENSWLGGGKIVAVNLSTGLSNIIYDSTTVDAINALSNPKSLALDSINNRVLVVDSVLDAVVAVDLSTGAPTIVSDPTTPDANNPLSYPSGIVMDSSNNRVLVVDSMLGAVVAVNLTTGARTIITDPTTPDAIHPLTNPIDLLLDSTNNRVLVADGYLADAVIAVDLTTGARTIISDAAMPNANNSLLSPRALVLDSTNNRVLLLDAVLNAVVAVDLVDGQRVILSR